MKNLFKNKLVLAAAVIIIILLVAVGGFFVYSSQNNKASDVPVNSGIDVKQLSPDDIGLTLTVRPDKKGVIMTIAKLEGVESVEYSLSYDANVTEEGQTAIVPRGVEGSPIQVKSGETKITRDLDLGTCSRNVCKFDDVVSDITVTIRVNYKDGTVGGVEEKISLEE